jgi:hypothetical protein
MIDTRRLDEYPQNTHSRSYMDSDWSMRDAGGRQVVNLSGPWKLNVEKSDYGNMPKPDNEPDLKWTYNIVHPIAYGGSVR